MHTWPCNSLIKNSTAYNKKLNLSKRPKNRNKDNCPIENNNKEWNSYVKEWKANKLIMLDQIPKISSKRG